MSRDIMPKSFVAAAVALVAAPAIVAVTLSANSAVECPVGDPAAVAWVLGDAGRAADVAECVAP